MIFQKEIEAGNEEAKEKLEEFYKNRKLCAEDVCTVRVLFNTRRLTDSFRRRVLVTV